MNITTLLSEQTSGRTFRTASVVVLAALILAAYVFLVTGGTGGTWPQHTEYYHELATAFSRGQLHLQFEIPRELIELQDPYDRQSRDAIPTVKAFVDKVWDVSYYEGRLYLYWGPVPALLALAGEMLFHRPLGDQYLSFAFASGLFLCSTLLMLRIADQYFNEVPFPLVLLGVLIAGLANPIPWMLSYARVYEAAIFAGQFFLFGGVLLVSFSLGHGSARTAPLVLAGVVWGLALGSRFATLVPVVFLCVLTLSMEYKAHRTQGLARAAASLGLPMLLILMGLFWYNWSRFGSILESGQQYQLNNFNYQTRGAAIFDWSYLAPNLWFYLVNPVAVVQRFPFLATTDVLPSFIAYPTLLGMYHLEEMAGLLLALPFSIFSLLPIIRLFRARPRGTIHEGDLGQDYPPALNWLIGALVGISTLAFVVLLSYFYVAMRFLADFTPSIVVLSAIGSWQAYRIFRLGRLRYVLYVAVLALTAIVSISAGPLLALGYSWRRYLRLNPELFRSIRRFFLEFF